MIYIYKVFGYRLTRFNHLGCVVKIKPTKNGEKDCHNIEILHLFQTSRTAFAFSKVDLPCIYKLDLYSFIKYMYMFCFLHSCKTLHGKFRLFQE